VKYQNLWNKIPAQGDLVEVGWDATADSPFIGVVTEVRTSPGDGEQKQMMGCVLVNGKPKWCDLYDLKPVKK
jgi:hypothetical protein